MSTSVMTSLASPVAGRQSDSSVQVAENSGFSEQAVRDEKSVKSFNTAMDKARVQTEKKSAQRHERQQAAVKSGKHLPSKETGANKTRTQRSAKGDSSTVKKTSDKHKKTQQTTRDVTNLAAAGEVKTAMMTAQAKGTKKSADGHLSLGGKPSGSAIAGMGKRQISNLAMQQAGGGKGHNSKHGLKTLATTAPSLNKETMTTLNQHLHGKAVDNNGQPILTANDHGGMKGLDKLLSMQKMVAEGNQGNISQTATSSLTDTRTDAAIVLPSSSQTTVVQTGTALYQSVIHESVGHMGWNQSMSGQVVWMASQNIRSAELKLNPANLGSIEVRIGIDDKNVKVAFGSHHALVREAIEQSIPRLREMMAQQGLTLANPDVSQQAFSQQQNSSFTQHGGQSPAFVSSTQADNNPVEQMMQQPLHSTYFNDGAVDYYI